MTYVVLQPHSNTNPSGNHRVVWDEDWTQYVNGAKATYAYQDFQSFPKAKETADQLNASLKKKAT